MIKKLENGEQLCAAVKLAARKDDWIVTYLLKTPEAASLVSEKLRRALDKIQDKVDAFMEDEDPALEEDFDQQALDALALNFNNYPVYMELFEYGNWEISLLSVCFCTESDVVWNEGQVRDIAEDVDSWA